MSRLIPTIVVVCLLAGTAAAFAVTEHLKLENSPIRSTKVSTLFSPVCRTCPHEATIGFRLRNEDSVRLDIVDSSGDVVRRGLVTQVVPARFRIFAWDGRDDSGRVVADGVYRARLTLEDEGRTIVFPDQIRVDATPPNVDDVALQNAVFSPDGDGRADRVNLAYRFSEPAYPVLYVGNSRKPRGYRKRPAGVIHWYGRGALPGTHRLGLAAQDLAGNLGPRRTFPVRIRYVELLRPVYRARPGRRLRIRVSTDATRLRVSLGGRAFDVSRRKGGVRAFSVVAPQQPGRYRLTVTANGRSARALVLVRGPGR